ncbi:MULTISPECIES: type II toxin-antitoxin system RelE/ParE family toxin [unclassified Serratia (in: enterobacteria)]|nr:MULTISPECIES: type II toxin-antitoxin system RelE/ParE family toxin [unclassified Serratia (in: enterobacteria)]
MRPALARYEPREVRRLNIGNYEIHYELRVNALYILRVWHTRENR